MRNMNYLELSNGDLDKNENDIGASKKPPPGDRKLTACENIARLFVVRFRTLSVKEKSCFLIIPLVALLFLSANLYNPTLLPVQLRFSPTCYRLSPRSNATQAAEDIPRYTYPSAIRRDYSYFNDHSWMPRFTTLNTHQDTIRLLGDIGKLFEANNVTYILHHGTLLGSFMFHDLIPWDDDLDILVSFDAINRVRTLFRDPRISEEFGAVSYDESIDIYGPPFIDLDVNPKDPYFCGNHSDLEGKTCKHKFHFYRQDSQKTLKRKIGYPYIDVKFYTENSTHIWPIDWELDDLSFEKNDFYPLHRRPFFDLWQPAPKETRQWLQLKFHKFKCASKWYSHHTQTIAMGYQSKCQYIKGCYPYVKRLPQCSKDKKDSFGVIEQLVIGDTVIHEAMIDEEYSEHPPFEL